MYKSFDIANASELPPLPEGYRYFDCIGGTQEKRYFLAPQDIPRTYFLKNYEHLLDECLFPIYNHNGICVRQDPSFPIPGFYIVSPVEHYTSLDQMDLILNNRLFLILHEIRKGMRERLGIKLTILIYEEKPKKSCSVHFLLLPIYSDSYSSSESFNFYNYLLSYEFSYRKYRNDILAYNQKMKDYIKEIKLQELDDLIESQTSLMLECQV
jgi:diadenosine tetraphosphate (Ap4A) HIT family hydrolase